MFLVNHNLKITTVKPSTKSIFVKKAPFLQSESNFKFNFNIKPEDQATSEISKLNLESNDKKEITTKDFHYQPSENNFRFNFCTNNSE